MHYIYIAHLLFIIHILLAQSRCRNEGQTEQVVKKTEMYNCSRLAADLFNKLSFIKCKLAYIKCQAI